MITIDGNFQEGGGQIVRTALALSTITGKSFTVKDIRKGRGQPGLKAQHLHGIKALKQLCKAEVDGAKLGSETVTFKPGQIQHKHLTIDIGTAGSITLLLQALLLPAIYSKQTLKMTITGGTDVKWSQPIDYFTNVFVPLIDRFAEVEVEVRKRGNYPKGGGSVVLAVHPTHRITPYELMTHGELLGIKGVSFASRDLRALDVAERQINSAKVHLDQLASVEIATEYGAAGSPGSSIVVWAEYEKTKVGADAMGEKGIAAEHIGERAAKKLIEEINHGAVVDSHAVDALIPFLGLATGSIKTSKITKHTLANIYVTQQFIPVLFSIEDNVITATKPAADKKVHK